MALYCLVGCCTVGGSNIMEKDEQCFFNSKMPVNSYLHCAKHNEIYIFCGNTIKSTWQLLTAVML